MVSAGDDEFIVTGKTTTTSSSTTTTRESNTTPMAVSSDKKVDETAAAAVKTAFEKSMLRGGTALGGKDDKTKRDLQNKCDQCNYCECDQNCDCIYNKCDQCNYCECDQNCDCIVEPTTPSVPEYVTPIWGCDGNGGACSCGYGGDGAVITMNRFFGDSNDEQVMGCGGAFALTGASLSGQWGGTQDSLAASIGLDFSQGASYYGWEGCCYVCGANLQLAGKLSSGWYCEKDFFSTGIWLKGIY